MNQVTDCESDSLRGLEGKEYSHTTYLDSNYTQFSLNVPV